jgi:signal peptidase I
VALTEPYFNHDMAVNNMAAPHPFDIVVPAGRLWVMGDHRYDSADSLENYDTYNPTDHDIMQATIPISSVIGRAFLLFWPFDRATWLSVPSTFSHVPNPS